METNNNPKVFEKPIRDIDFDELKIPDYQRPYKWTVKNVNQLISDLICFRDKKQYRLGTLVLNDNNLVDGQQRIITLSLLLNILFARKCTPKKKEFHKKFIKKLEKFMDGMRFSNRYSLHNIVVNIHAIEERINDMDESIIDFILNHCEFVVIDLKDISEAFQFFDSQNARGKDLEAHDLLKAYHLREISNFSSDDSENINKWQSQKTQFLQDIFLTLYRAKRWSSGKSARYFTKNNTDEFKGISISDERRYPFYQLEVIAHIFSSYYNTDPIRKIDRQRIEFPFNLDDQIINGGRFFDMVRHYMELYLAIQDEKSYNPDGIAQEIIRQIKDYNGSYRTGDTYVRDMFHTTLLYYVDRFGWVELEKVVPKLIIWAYRLRFDNPAVQRASMDNYAKGESSMLRIINGAKTPYDIINVYQEGFNHNQIKCSKCEEIRQLIDKLGKYYSNE